MKKFLSAAAIAALLSLGFISPSSAGSAKIEPALVANTTTETGWLHTDGGTIKTSSNAPYVIKSISWFGLETNNCTPHGLWTINLDSGLDQIAKMGFNTVRLPYSNECLAKAKPDSINYYKNPDLQNKKPQEIMDIFIAKAKSKGLKVILDRHRPDSGSQSELWYTSAYSEARWIADWKMLAQRYKNDPTVIGVDLHNEPRGNACWGCGNAKTDWQAAATRGGNAVLSVNPNLLIIVEGVENVNGDYSWWGGNLQGVASKPVKLNVANRVVYSPHDYPASVYNQKWFGDSRYPANLTSVWDKNWGYIKKQNIAPVLLGEFGTKLETDSDKKWMSEIVKYLDSNGMSYSYWSFNPNSSDTGGIVKEDWSTPQQAKLEALAPLLKGTVVAPTPITPKPTPTTPKPVPTTPTTPKPTPAPTTPTTPNSAVQAKWILQSSWNGGYVANVEVKATKNVNGWTVSFPDPGATKVVNSWGMKCSIFSGIVTCTGSDWTTKLTANQTYNVGMQVDSKKAPVSPSLVVKSF